MPLFISHASNELFWGSLFLFFTCTLGPLAIPLWLLCTTGAFVALWIVLFAQRLGTRFDVPQLMSPPVPDFIQHSCTTNDGLRLSYYVSRPRTTHSKDANESIEGRRVVLLCAPLGQSGPMVYAPLLATLGDDFVFITWDYRGFFTSDCPRRKRRVGISAHADDGSAVLRAAGCKYASIVVGHSLGVQVALELTLLWPEQVERLVLLNGCHGHAFATAFQPVVRIPLVGTATLEYVRLLQRQPWLFTLGSRIIRPWLKYALSPIFCACFGSPLLRHVLGPNYLYNFWHSYVSNITDTRGNLPLFLYSFLEINAHSCFHLLDKIDQPALIISGMLDPLLPALVSREMAARMRHAKHVCDPCSTHTTLLESPEWALHHIHEFLRSTQEPSLDLAHQQNRHSL